MKPAREVLSVSIQLFEEKDKARAILSVESLINSVALMVNLLKDFTMSDEELVGGILANGDKLRQAYR